MGIAMTVTAAGGSRISGLNSSGMQSPIVSGVRVGMAVAAIHASRDGIVRYSLNVGVAVGAVEAMVNRITEPLVFDMDS
jgi:hypothetical protein